MLKYTLNDNHKGYIAATISSIFFGCSGLFVKLAQGSGLDAIHILILEYIIAVPFMWSISFLKYRKQIKISKKNLIKLFFIGMFLQSSTSICYYSSFKYLDISIATILLFTYPILVTIYSCIFSKTKPNKIILLSLIVAFIGCVLILDLFHIDPSFSVKGVLFGLGGALFLATSNLSLETFKGSIPPFILLTYISTFMLLNLLIFRFPSGLLHENISSFQWITIALLTFICQIPPVLLMYISIQYIGAVKTGIVSNVEIPVAAFLGYIFYGETLNILQLFGIVLVVGGIMLMQNSEYIQNKLLMHSLKIRNQRL